MKAYPTMVVAGSWWVGQSLGLVERSEVRKVAGKVASDADSG